MFFCVGVTCLVAHHDNINSSDQQQQQQLHPPYIVFSRVSLFPLPLFRFLLCYLSYFSFLSIPLYFSPCTHHLLTHTPTQFYSTRTCHPTNTPLTISLTLITPPPRSVLYRFSISFLLSLYLSDQLFVLAPALYFVLSLSIGPSSFLYFCSPLDTRSVNPPTLPFPSHLCLCDSVLIVHVCTVSGVSIWASILV